MSLTEYKPGTTFPGVVGRTYDQSSPAWPEPLRAKEGAASSVSPTNGRNLAWIAPATPIIRALRKCR
jgi:hypothetical protein